VAPATILEQVERLDTGSGGPGRPRGRDGGGEDGGRPGDPRRFGPQQTPRRAYFTGLYIGLGAILMFFLALASAYVVRKGLGGDWQAIALPPVLWLNTLALVASSLALERARRGVHAADEARFRSWWWAGLALGVVFLAGQWVAWRQLAAQGVFLATNPSSSFFYVFTAAHAAHLLGGLIAVGYVALRGFPHARRTGALAADLSAGYWHFMDLLWIGLVLLLTLGR
jgi:cytochrome c oxidase subunit 3